MRQGPDARNVGPPGTHYRETTQTGRQSGKGSGGGCTAMRARCNRHCSHELRVQAMWALDKVLTLIAVPYPEQGMHVARKPAGHRA